MVNNLHYISTRRQNDKQNKDESKSGIIQSTFSVKVLNLFSRSRRKTNKRKSKHSAMLRNKETRHRMFRSEERRVGKECRSRRLAHAAVKMRQGRRRCPGQSHDADEQFNA